MLNTIPRLALLTSVLTLAACATTAPSPATHSTAAPQPKSQHQTTAANYAADRAAILSMLGEYAVTFHFEETVPLKAGYTRHEAKNTGANEVVVLIEDRGDFISLQHLLVVGGDGTDGSAGAVVKHWRQDWHFEAQQRWEFSADQTWTVQQLPANKIAGHWTQCVYEVSDAPRYCGTGKWNHRYGTPTWTSDRSWRPLPRREYTKRDDYNALNVENRHSITPVGWTHEQDNTKTVRHGSRTAETLTREFGYNEYVRQSDFDFTPAYEYWEATAEFWAQVRQQWSQRIAQHDGIHLTTSVDGMAIIGPMFGLAAKVQAGESVAEADIAEVLNTHTAAASGAKAAVASR